MNNKWELFEIENHEEINAFLDKRFIELINIAKRKIQEGEKPLISGHNVRKNMEFLMGSIEGYGASDTEPRAVLLNSICKKLDLPLNKNTMDQI